MYNVSVVLILDFNTYLLTDLPKKYDEWLPEASIRTVGIPQEPYINQLLVSIKESLCPSKEESKVTIRQHMSPIQFSTIQTYGKIQKRSARRIVYSILNRHGFNHMLGVGWDYRVINTLGDNYYI